MTQAILSEIVLIIATHGASAQSPSTNLEFDVASVKVPGPHSSKGGRITAGGPGTRDPSRFAVENWPLSTLISSAYDLARYQLSAPSWMFTTGFDITAKIPEGTTRKQFRIMLQNLLAERFKLATHREKREMTVYELVARGDHPKLKESAKDLDSSPRLDEDGLPILPVDYRNGQIRVDVRNESMEQFAKRLSGQVRGQVTDATGLKGNYDIVLTWSAARLHTTDTEDAPEDSHFTLFTALQDQLGLKLVPRKGLVEVLVIDRAEKIPTEN